VPEFDASGSRQSFVRIPVIVTGISGIVTADSVLS
jgi:hypothetical protein